MNRRDFSKKLAVTAMFSTPVLAHSSKILSGENPVPKPDILLGGPVFRNEYDSPSTWLRAVRNKGYHAALCPVDETADDQLVNEYRGIAESGDIVIAEVGVWKNTLESDDEMRKKAIEISINKLDLADRIHARCCVNVAGSLGNDERGGLTGENLTAATFDLIVETTRKIIDAVKPKNTFFTLEMMPYYYPDSVDSYLDLIRAIDRKKFGVHFDPVNLMNSPARYYNNASVIKDAFARLGTHIRSCHAKDTIMKKGLTVVIEETRPGTGILDYRVFLKELSKVNKVPLMMEHMKRDEYPLAAEYIRRTGKEIGLNF